MIRTAWQLVTAAATPLISVEEAKSHLEVTVNDWDADIARRIRSAIQQTERELGRGLVTQTWKYVQDIFTDVLWLPMAAPLQSVTSVKYYDTAGALQTLSTSVYLQDLLSEPGRVVLAPNQAWPATQANRLLAVEVTYVVGWTTVDTVPADILDAVYLRLGTRQQFRESVLAGNGSIAVHLPDGAKAMLAPHQVFWREPRSDEYAVDAC